MAPLTELLFVKLDREGEAVMKKTKAYMLGAVATAGLFVGDMRFQAAWAKGAEEGADTIIVTARFREEVVQDIGASISALDSEALEREGIQDFEDISRRTVGLDLVDRGPNQNDLAIRGVSNGTGLRLADLGSAGPLVSQFLDDVAVSSATASQRDFNFFDFDRVEILRGPQPTLFGEGSVGGTVRYFTKEPDLSGAEVNDSVLRAGVSFTKGGAANYTVSGASSLVVIPEKLGIRGVINYRDDDGFIDNPTLGLEDINDYESISGRAVVLFKPTEQLKVRFSAFLGRDDIGETNQVNTPPATKTDLVFDSPIDGDNEDNFDLYSGKIEYDFGGVVVSSITGFYKRNRTDEFFDAQSAAAFGAFTVPLTALGVSQFDDHSITEEIRIASNLDGPLNFTGGFFFQDTKATSTLATTAPEFAPFTFPAGGALLIGQENTVASTQYSGFVELTYSVTEQLRIIAGARYVNEEITNISLTSQAAFGSGAVGVMPPFFITDVNGLAGLLGFSLDETFRLSKVLPRGAIEYDANDDVMLYAIASTGVRNRNLNPFTSALRAAGAPPSQAAFEGARSFDEDSVLSFEAGIKTSWLDGAINANLSAYYTDFKDPQILTSNPLVLTVNGPDQKIIGAELETQWGVNEFLDLYGNLSYQHVEFTDGALLTNPAALAAIGFGGTEDLMEGSHAVNSPKWSASLGADFYYPLNERFQIVGNVAYQYIGSRFSTVQNYPASELKAQNFVNLRFGLVFDNISLVGFASNATNEIEYQSIQGNTGTPILAAGGGLDFIPTAVAINRPRTIGAELTLRY